MAQVGQSQERSQVANLIHLEVKPGKPFETFQGGNIADLVTAQDQLLQLSQAAQRCESSVVLADALAELPAERREVIMLRNFKQLDWEEIAQKMERSPAAARMLWTRALAQLRPLLEARL